jgi:hypothetical protein
MDKRHFTVVIGSKEHGLYISLNPSSAAKKAVSKLCASNKSKKVEFCLREITQGSKKKTYGPYLGEMKKLKKPIELKGRVIRYEINVHLKKGKSSTKKTAKKMRGGEPFLNEDVIDDFIKKKNFQEILNAIFNGRLSLHKLILLSTEKKNFLFFTEMIDYINSLESNENKNKYFFIICYIIDAAHKNDTIINHLISVIGLDKFIKIVFQTDYVTVFDRIIYRYHNEEKKISSDINYVKRRLFMILIYFYQNTNMSLDEFEKLFIKLFSLQDYSFIIEYDYGLLDELYAFFKNKSKGGGDFSSKYPSFKLFNFLLEHKEKLHNFIRILKNKYDHQKNKNFLIYEDNSETKNRIEELFRNR